jgi:hypothetical protein
LEIVVYGESMDVRITNLTAGGNVTIPVGVADVYTGTLTGITSAATLIRVSVTDHGSGYLIGLFMYESSLTAGDLP